MGEAVAFIGFGEAGSALSGGGPARGYDRKTDHAETRLAKLGDFARTRVAACNDAATALDGASAILSLVTADQALIAARDAAPLLAPGALWFDMNSVAPETKRTAAEVIEAAGGRYVDVAVMAPVHPAGMAVPLLISGPHAETGAQRLAGRGFANVRVVPGPVGAASAIKMIRSVMIKGMEALSAECVIAAERAGVTGEVLASLGEGWADKADYNLDRMMAHGLRRAAEMEEVVKTLETLGVSAALARATVAWQRSIGSLGMAPPRGLAAKLAAIDTHSKEGTA